MLPLLMTCQWFLKRNRFRALDHLLVSQLLYLRFQRTAPLVKMLRKTTLHVHITRSKIITIYNYIYIYSMGDQCTSCDKKFIIKIWSKIMKANSCSRKFHLYTICTIILDQIFNDKLFITYTVYIYIYIVYILKTHLINRNKI